MGRVQRKTSQYLQLYRKKYKKKALTILSFTPPTASKNEFVELFYEVYPDDVFNIEKHYEFYQEKNKNRKKGKPLYFPHPSDFLYQLAKNSLNKNNREEWDFLRAEKIKEKALKESVKEKETKEIRYRSKNISTQEVTPKYIDDLIYRYWNESSKEKRLSIVIETGKFKNTKTILFFRKIMSNEKDWFIINHCFRTLQRFDQIVFLPPKGKGGKEQYDYLSKTFGCDYKEDIGKTPKDIVEDFYGENYIEKTKDFDVFISHSVSNANNVDKLVYDLNNSGLVAFVDWKSDRQDLKRSKSSAYTAKVLELRMKQSKALILIRTNESDSSIWVSWEIGYFTALGKKIAILDLGNNHTPKPDFLKDLPIVRKIDGDLMVIESFRTCKITDWISYK